MYCGGSGGFWGGFPWMGGGAAGVFFVAILIALGVGVGLLLGRRPRKKSPAIFSCPHCAGAIQNVYFHCPHCGKVLKSHCPGCSRVVDHEWVFCPFCQQGLQPQPGVEGEAP